MPSDELARDRERLFWTIGACPECGAAFQGQRPERAACDQCGTVFARGRDAFFVHAPLAPADLVQHKTAPHHSIRDRLHAPSLSYNNRRAVLERMVSGNTGIVLDLGSGDRRLGSRVLNLDVAEYVNVDVVCGQGRLPIHDQTVDLVICQAVLEHVADAPSVVQEILRVLTKGGLCYTEVPFLQAFHADPNDFVRFTHVGLQQLFGGFEILEGGVCVGPCSALAWQVRETLLVPLGPGRIRRLAYNLLGWSLVPLSQFDRIFARFPHARRAAGGLFVLARKIS